MKPLLGWVGMDWSICSSPKSLRGAQDDPSSSDKRSSLPQAQEVIYHSRTSASAQQPVVQGWRPRLGFLISWEREESSPLGWREEETRRRLINPRTKASSTAVWQWWERGGRLGRGGRAHCWSFSLFHGLPCFLIHILQRGWESVPPFTQESLRIPVSSVAIWPEVTGSHFQFRLCHQVAMQFEAKIQHKSLQALQSDMSFHLYDPY